MTMENITNIRHPLDGTLLSFAYLIQSIAYYSVQGAFLFFMMDSFMQYDMSEAIHFYGMILLIPYLARVIGGLLGDLLFGNQNTMIAGGLLQAIGAFLMLIPNEFSFFIGVFLVFSGGGIYRPNLQALFGKAYLDRLKLLDGGFSLLYLSLNLGMFIGVIVGALIGELYGYKYSFLLSAGMMIIGLIPFFFLKNSPSIEQPKPLTNKKFKALKVGTILLIIGFFFCLLNLADSPGFHVREGLKSIEAFGIPKSYWKHLPTAATIIVLTLTTVLWKIIYIKRKTKLLISAIAGLLSFIVLLFVPDFRQSIEENHIVIFLAFILFKGIADAIIVPIVNSWIIEYTNKKYYAIILSLTDISIRVFTYVISYYAYGYINYSFSSPAYFGIFGMSLFVIGTVAYMLISKSNERPIEKSKDLLDG